MHPKPKITIRRSVIFSVNLTLKITDLLNPTQFGWLQLLIVNLLPGIEPKSKLNCGIRTRYKTGFDFGTGNETWIQF
jgi:hypothetical protein